MTVDEIAPAGDGNRDTSSRVLDHLLFGSNPTERIVAVETEDNEAVLFRRDETDRLSTESVPFAPWLMADRDVRVVGAEVESLAGEGYDHLIRFPGGWRSYQEGRRSLRDSQAQVLQYGSATKQFLISSGHTLFKGMVFDDPRRLQLDIETRTLSPFQPGAAVFMVSLRDNRGFSDVLIGDEPAILRALVQTLQERDPDIIEGHNIYNFDLPYLMARFEAHGIPAALGRDERPISIGTERNCAIGANSRPFKPVYIYGRNILDTYLQVQRFDASRGQVSSYGLKECAQTYGIAAQDRVYLDRAQIWDAYAADADRVRRYALQDVEETAGLAALVAPAEFYQTQMAPDTYQSVAVTGNGEKINSLLIREYYRAGHAIPKQKPSAPYPGGYTDVLMTGVIKPIVKCDVESLYPSLMLSQRIAPQSDSLNIFLPLLEDLTRRRLEAKAHSKVAAPLSRDQSYWEGMQLSFKTLINSFYGYIGGPFYFNDYAGARQVTEAGQEIVKQIAAKLGENGARVVEIDTDGVYFQPPDHVRGEAAEVEYVASIGASLPAGIRLAHDGSYDAMISLKIKNYVLVEPGGRKIFKGSSLRSRADERFGRRFLADAVDLLLEGSLTELATLYRRFIAQIEEGAMPIEMLAKRERVTEKLLNSDLRKRAAAAIQDAGISEGDFVSLYQRSDRSLGLVDLYAGDEDRDHYAMKLYKFAGRLREAITPEQFETTFPKPIPLAKRADPAQMTMDLFG